METKCLLTALAVIVAGALGTRPFSHSITSLCGCCTSVRSYPARAVVRSFEAVHSTGVMIDTKYLTRHG